MESENLSWLTLVFVSDCQKIDGSKDVSFLAFRVYNKLLDINLSHTRS